MRREHGLNQVWFRAEKNGQVLADVGLGGANPDAPIHVASLAKSITAIAVALLIQDGRLTLDSDLGELLAPMFAQRGHQLEASLNDITVERLLSHTAGLRASSSVDPVNGLRSSQVLDALNDNATVFDYIVTSGGDHSNGERRYSYSKSILCLSRACYRSCVRRKLRRLLPAADFWPAWNSQRDRNSRQISRDGVLRRLANLDGGYDQDLDPRVQPRKPIDLERDNPAEYSVW